MAWCPQRSTAFAAAAGHTLQLWDVEHSALRPRATAAHYGIKLSALSFSPTGPVLAVGGSDGSVSIYSVAALLEGKAASDTNEEAEQQRKRLRAVLHAQTENKRAIAEE